jgi:hypothetical protein
MVEEWPSRRWTLTGGIVLIAAGWAMSAIGTRRADMSALIFGGILFAAGGVAALFSSFGFWRGLPLKFKIMLSMLPACTGAMVADALLR